MATGQIIVESGAKGRFPVAVQGRRARPKSPAANDNPRPLSFILHKVLGYARRSLLPLIGTAIIIFVMTQ